jgi:spermidine synthase
MSKETHTIEAEREKAGFTFQEAIHPGVDVSIELKAILASDYSEYQKIDVIETSFGKMLVTDGKTQSAQMDEFSYHETLVHPSLLQATLLLNQTSKPRSVFIGGGGELATAREVLRHKSVDRVVMVDLDKKVVDLCKKYLPEWGGERVASNDRFELIHGDAYEYLNNCTELFDVIIMDISDPIEAGPGIMLYTKEFYEHAKTLLNPNGGVFVTQAGVADPIRLPSLGDAGSEEDTFCFAPIKNTLETVFECVIPYSINIPSFGSDWGFVMAFNPMKVSSSSPKNIIESFVSIDVEKIDEMVSTCITEIEDVHKNGSARDGQDVLRYYDGLTHRRMFALPKPLRADFKKDKRVMTKDNPVFMF